MANRKSKDGLFKTLDYTLMTIVGLISFGVVVFSGTLIWLISTL